MLRVDGYRREMVEFQKAITAIPAVGPEKGGDGEWERFLFLRDWLEKVGLGVAEEHHASDDRVRWTSPQSRRSYPGKGCSTSDLGSCTHGYCSRGAENAMGF